MKDTLLVLLALGCGLLVYKTLDHKEPAAPQVVYVTPPPTPAPAPRPVQAVATPRPRRLTTEGTFYLLDYVSTTTAHGVIGFEPGALVRFVKADEAREKLMVTDGKCEVEVSPEQLTNDCEIADLVRRRDQDSQHQVAVAQEAAFKEYQKAERQIEIDRSRNVASIKQAAPVGSRRTALDEDSVPASALDRAAIRDGYYSYQHSPYYYLHRSRYYNVYPTGY